MMINSLDLFSFRNYQNLRAEFSPGVNLIYGKTRRKNQSAGGRGVSVRLPVHRARTDKELISFGSGEAAVRAAVKSRDREFLVEIRLYRGRRRCLAVNGVRQKNAAALSDVLHTVLFCPEDLTLISQGGGGRRRFLDDSICQLRPRYAAALSEYNRLYEHKTRILRDWPEKPSLLDTLDEFSARMARAGALLIHYRAHYVRRLTGFAAGIHRDFSGDRETLELRYETVKTIRDPFAPAE
jgi:DNA replication and repair protein RecF